MRSAALPVYITPNIPLIVTVTGATPVRCSLNMSRCAEGERTKAIIVRFEILLELLPSNPFVSGEFLKPFLHFGMAKVYAKATLNYLGNAPSRRQERIEICVE
jgi:hypothetical protein